MDVGMRVSREACGEEVSVRHVNSTTGSNGFRQIDVYFGHSRRFHAFLQEAAALNNLRNPLNTPQESPAASTST
ncbi:hypothetical protein E2C01_065760 [Portunus trituberculatus]|uniref:Uncharacterized protein n=1 Tax=Portunus trituberculatus TaxID=210409 RepID=A0A5B7HJQ8_PORTR|nr:hypothetical protein [Portunus trituberculatus]